MGNGLLSEKPDESLGVTLRWTGRGRGEGVVMLLVALRISSGWVGYIAPLQACINEFLEGKMSFLFSGFMYDHLKTFKPVFYLAAGPMIFGAFLLLFATLCKSNQTSLGRQDVTSLVSSPKHCNGLHSSYRRCSCPPKILLTAPGDRESLIVVERLTVI